MSSAIQCPQCGRSFSVGDENLGKRGRCKGCGTVFTMSSVIGSPQAAAEARGDRPPSRFQSSDTSTPARLGRFVIRKRLGAGAFGMVYRAYDPQLDREVALKVPQAGTLDTPQAQERFLREAKAAAQLRHPHIVPVFDAGRDGECSYIASAFIEGETLADAVADGPLHRDEAARIVAALADALAYAHSLGIIHRDVKPSNVMIDDKGQPHLMDFGLARLEGSAEKLTHDGAVLGTPAYMSPEQAAGTEVTATSDQYSLGVLLYELLCGETPFRGPPQVVIHNVLSQEPARPRSINPTVSADLETICLKAMSKVPGDRFEECRKFADDLRRWLNDEPIRARRHGLLERAIRWERRNSTVATLLGVVILLLLILAGVATVQESRTRAALQKAQATAGRLAEAQTGTREALRQSQRLLCKSTVERGIDACEQGEVDRAMHWMLQALTIAERENFRDLERPIRRNLTGLSREITPLKTNTTFPVMSQRFPVITPDGVVALFRSQPPDRPGETILWDSRAGAVTGKTLQLGSFLQSAAFSSDGKTLVTGGYDRTVRLWNAEKGEAIGASLQTPGPLQVVALSPDGASFLTVYNATWIQRWSTETGMALGPVHRHQGRLISAAAFAPSGDKVLFGGEDGAWLWPAEQTRDEELQLDHPGWVICVAFSQDGKRALTGGADHMVRLWDVATRKPIGSPLQHRVPVVALALSPDGDMILTGTIDSQAHLWNARTGAAIGPSLHHDREVGTVVFSRDGQTAFTGTLSEFRGWDLRNFQSLSATGHSWVGEITRILALSTDGEIILSADSTNVPRLHRVSTGETIGQPLKVDNPAGISDRVVAFSRDNATLWIASGLTARPWDATTGMPLEPKLHDRLGFGSLAISPDGSKLLTGTLGYEESSKFRLWDVKTGKFRELNTRGSVGIARFSPDGRRAITVGSSSTSGQLWDVNTAASVGPDLYGMRARLATAFSPDSTMIAGCDYDHTARLWSAKTGESVRGIMRHGDAVNALAFSPDSLTVLTGSRDSTARLWNAKSAEPVSPPLMHRSSVLAVAFSPDGSVALTVSEDEVRLWDAATGIQIGRALPHQGVLSTLTSSGLPVAFSGDGLTIVIVGHKAIEVIHPQIPSDWKGPAAALTCWLEERTGTTMLADGYLQTLTTFQWKRSAEGSKSVTGPPPVR